MAVDEARRGEEARLQPGLKQRHMTMISLGGVIGAGLFVGSGAILNAAGPAAVLTYALTGLLVVLIMRMLGEMAVARPSVGSFSDYARISLGNWAGFTIGWLYWYFWVIVVGVEAVAGAGIIAQYLPGVPLWAIALGVIVLLTLTNLYSVGSFGEFEFWFASIKVVAIIVFIFLGGLYVFGLWPSETPGLSNLYANGGFAPAGGLAVFSGITTVIFAFVGAEIVTIAAAESAEPERGVARAVNAVVYRVLLFYVLSVFLVAAIVPWNSSFTSGNVESPFAVALETMGIPGAATVMNFVILTALLSVLNSSLYTSSRMLFALTRHGDAPRFFTNTTARGVPMWAILAGTIIGYVSVLAAYFFPAQVFTFLLNSSGAVALFVYLLIAVSELRMRRRLEREDPERLQLKMWLYPWLTYLSIAAILAVLVSMAFTEDGRPQLLATIVSVVLFLGAYGLRSRYGRVRSRSAEPAR
ncbi:amino acid permease [Rubrobacter marinus]|uniref:Amino acid permease n=1 Tax=Rubrobacter marinus TaxID=2653852 RepID=A0A6G8PTS4_9ACTN|nr:amino acid permease [Rubrobacter marinus]QIN77830.1 amino acid permease [Rubrobacter marinus]